MSRKVTRVPYNLDASGVEDVPFEQLKAILRGADDLIMQGGRTQLVGILKGSRAKKVLELKLNQSPVYGYFSHLSKAEVQARVDWAILNGYLTIDYDYRLPLLKFTQKGWEIERETYANELLETINGQRKAGPPFLMSYLKDRDRDMIFILLDKIEATGDPGYIPILQAWQQVDYKKVRQRIQRVIDHLVGEAG